jgi:hypothetical protein
MRTVFFQVQKRPQRSLPFRGHLRNALVSPITLLYLYLMRNTVILAILLVFSCSGNAQTAECGTVVPAGYEQILAQRIASARPVERGSLIVVPVQVHLIRESNGNSTLTLQQIQDELDSVNFYYANAGLVFYQCLAAEMIDDDNLYDYNSSQQSILLTNYFMTNVINLYFANTVSTSSGTVCGYSYFPGGPDACFISAQCMNGSTLAHELGHYFGLMHTHGGSNDELVDGTNCASEGDLICDTPADPGLSGLVDTACIYTGNSTDANNMFYLPPVHNIMSYSRKVCRNEFTPMQYTVINNTYWNDRTYLLCTPLSVTTTTATGISLFPNPAADHIEISGVTGNEVVSIYDPAGRLIRSEAILSGAKNTIIPLGDLNDGTYICIITGAEGIIHTQRIVILH